MANTYTLKVASFGQHHLDSSTPMGVLACIFHAISGMPNFLLVSQFFCRKFCLAFHKF
jgi:hypothetical protein